MKFLITGGAGFIGSNLSAYLIEQGNRVKIIDNLSSGSIDNFYEHIKEIDLFEESILETKQLDKIIADCDAVFHLAANVGVKKTIEQPIETFEINALGSKKVFKSCQKHNIPVIFTSSSEVYGLNENLPLSENSLRIYNSPPQGRWIYAQSKIVAEAYCHYFAKKGLKFVILRYFNCYGPNMTHNSYSSVISKFFLSALKNEPLTVYDDGSQTRSFTYVKDLVLATYKALENKTWGKTMNLGTEHDIQIIKLANIIKEICNSDSPVVFVDPKNDLGNCFSETPKRKPDISRAKMFLGFKPVTSLDNGLHSTFEWIKKDKHARAA